VIAWKLGEGHPERLIFVGGHYDSRTLNVTDGTSPAPGANDSGSQTSLVLEAARVMAAESFDATPVFVAFAGEEQGLVGSRSLAMVYAKYRRRRDPRSTTT
jgi:Zn-dependent M28 family amino/carboxypeptidase